MFCTKCGNMIPENSRFCTGCGAPVSVENIYEAAKAKQAAPVKEIVINEEREGFSPERPYIEQKPKQFSSEMAQPMQPAYVEPVQPAFVEPVQPVQQPFAEPMQPAFVEPVQPTFAEPVQPVQQPFAEPVQPMQQPFAQPVQPVQQPFAQPVQPMQQQYAQPMQPAPYAADEIPATRGELPGGNVKKKSNAPLIVAISVLGVAFLGIVGAIVYLLFFI